MRFEEWTAAWPHWANRWWGVAIRVVLGAAGTIAGVVILRSAIGAGGSWDATRLSDLVRGVLGITLTLAMVIRPSRLTLLVALLSLALLSRAGILD